MFRPKGGNCQGRQNQRSRRRLDGTFALWAEREGCIARQRRPFAHTVSRSMIVIAPYRAVMTHPRGRLGRSGDTNMPAFDPQPLAPKSEETVVYGREGFEPPTPEELAKRISNLEVIEL